MKAKDIVELAFQRFRTRSLRFLLTVFGVGVGIGVVFFLVSLGFGLQELVIGRISSSESLLSLDVAASEDAAKILPINQATIEEFKKIPQVEDVSPLLSSPVEVNHGQIKAQSLAQGVNPNYFRYAGINPLKGNLFGEQNNHEVVVSKTFLRLFDLNQDDAIGKEINLTLFLAKPTKNREPDKKPSIAGKSEATPTPETPTSDVNVVAIPEPFKIVGILDDDANSIYIPLSVVNVSDLVYSQTKVRVATKESINPVRDALVSKGYSVRALTDTLNQLNQIFRATQVTLAVLGIVALFIASVGMFNTLTISLLERTRDDETEKGMTVTVTNGTTLEFAIYQDRLILQHETGSNITNAHLDTANNANDSDIDAIYTMDTDDNLTMGTGTELFINSGDTYTPGATVSVDNIDINGTFAMEANAVTVTGTWDATGGNFTGNNTVTFNATAPETITSNGHAFNNVVYNMTENGSITNSDAITVSGTQTVNGSSGAAESDTTPPTISAIAVTAAETSATVTWTTNEAADSKVEYGKGNTGTSSTDTTLTLRHAVTLSNLDANTSYNYKITSKDASNNSASSETGTFTTLKAGTTTDTTAPTISNIQVTDVTSSGATVSWVTNEDAVGYLNYGESTVYNRGASSGDASASKSKTVTIVGLAPATSYHYQIVAIDAAGNVTKSSDQTLTTIAEEETPTATEVFQETSSRSSSDAPKLSSDAPKITDISGTSVKISWETNEKATSVVYYRPLGSKDDPIKVGDPSFVSSHSVVLQVLKDATAYEYSVESKDSEGNKVNSERYEFTTRLPEVKNVSVQDLSSSSAQFVYETESATSSILELKNVLTGETINLEDDSLLLEHKISLDNLEPDTEYAAVVLIKGNNDDVKRSLAYIFRTRPDTLDPMISAIETRSALMEGEKDKVQTIITWMTNKPTSSQVEYNEGLTRGGEFKYKMPKVEDLVTKHVVVLPDLQPSTVYEYRVKSVDRAGREVTSEPRVLLTPQRRVSAFDLIIRNLEDTFGWTKQMTGR